MIARSTLGGGRWSGGCPSRDIFSMLVAYCSRCFLLRMPIFRNCRLHTGPIRIRYSIRIHSDRKWPERIVYDTSLPTITPPQIANTEQSAASPATIASAKPREQEHLRNCHRLMQTSCNHPIQKSENRSRNASAKLQNDTRRRLCSWWRGNGNSAGLPIGEQRLSPAHPGQATFAPDRQCAGGGPRGSRR